MKLLLTTLVALIATCHLHAMDIEISINGHTFTADVEDTETGRAFLSLLPLTLDMSELNGNEKYHYLASGLPTDAHYCSTIHAGDLMLYGNSCVVLFYGDAGGFSYTRLGRLHTTEGLAEAVGRGSVAITFSALTTDMRRPSPDGESTDAIHDLSGRAITGKQGKGIFIQNGKKILRK